MLRALDAVVGVVVLRADFTEVGAAARVAVVGAGGVVVEVAGATGAAGAVGAIGVATGAGCGPLAYATFSPTPAKAITPPVAIPSTTRHQARINTRPPTCRPPEPAASTPSVAQGREAVAAEQWNPPNGAVNARS
ncbi:hypothetical protein [Pseudonocardia sp. NPDC049154]|uniref:hypothetical protein n=1 Tax=Pseudonocardia sp. NPDC049154 TaxID=3155501 RepID=UPI0033C355E6